MIENKARDKGVIVDKTNKLFRGNPLSALADRQSENEKILTILAVVDQIAGVQIARNGAYHAGLQPAHMGQHIQPRTFHLYVNGAMADHHFLVFRCFSIKSGIIIMKPPIKHTRPRKKTISILLMSCFVAPVL